MTGQSVTVVVYKSWVWCLVVDKVTCDSVLVVGYEKPVATDKDRLTIIVVNCMRGQE